MTAAGGTPLVSVITVVRNGEATLERTIRSVLSQTYAPIEYIVIDGQSTDGTLDIVRRYEDQIDFWISEPDGGIYDAMNKGIARANGEWIQLLNGDDRYADEGALARIVPRLDPERLNYGSILLESAEGNRRLHSYEYRRWLSYFYAGVLHMSTILSRRQYERVGLYDLRFPLASDHDLILRMSEVFPPLHHDTVLTVMPQTGASAKWLWKACWEFKRVAERHGVPGWLAAAAAVGKYALWRTPVPCRRILRKALFPKSAYR
ncbi:MAG: glycosyltransferase [Elusimicrobia bacterium]|nr:glycosyltransferase [Elusimicrobiota bacterium]